MNHFKYILGLSQIIINFKFIVIFGFNSIRVYLDSIANKLCKIYLVSRLSEIKKLISKFEIFFEKARKNIEEDNSNSKFIFLIRRKKIHFEVKKSTSKLKLF